MIGPLSVAVPSPMQAFKTRNETESRHDHLGSDNVTLCKLPPREWIILRAQSAQKFAAIVARFLAKIQKTDTCWLWTASVGDAYGHGQFTIRDAAGTQHHLYAHRVAWVLSGRYLPPLLQLCHICDVGRCVRPRHLFVGTQRDNLNDAIAKGRLVCGVGARKLSDEAYRDILTKPYYHGSGVAMARRYGVCKLTIFRIRHGRQGSTYKGQRP